MKLDIKTGLIGWLVVVNCPLMGPGLVGVFLRNLSPHLPEFRKKPTENPEHLGRQVRSGIELGTSSLPAFESRTTLPLEGH